MPELKEAMRNRLHDDQFAYEDKSGEPKLPIHDADHVRNAIARFSQTEFDDDEGRKIAAKRIIRAAGRYGIDIEDDDFVVRASKS